MREYRWSVLFVVCLILGNMSVWPSAASSRSMSGTADEWIEANANSLPEHWDDMARVPFPIRKHVLQRLSPQVKKAIWQDGLTRFLQNRTLTSQQQALIAQAEIIVPAAIDGVSVPDSPICSDIGAAFSSEKDRLAFGEILMPGPRTHSEVPKGLRSWLQAVYQPWVVIAREPVREESFHCNCAYETSCTQCGGNTCLCSDCTETIANVDPWPNCGCLGLFNCLGTCGSAGGY